MSSVDSGGGTNQVSGYHPDIKSVGDGFVTVDGKKMSTTMATSTVLMASAEYTSQQAYQCVGDVQDQVNEMNEAKTMLQEMNAQLDSATDTKPAVMSKKMSDWLSKNGVAVSATSQGTPGTDGQNTAYSSSEWETNIGNLKDKIDELTQNQQVSFIKLKTLMENAANAYKGASSVVAKAQQMSSGISQKF